VPNFTKTLVQIMDEGFFMCEISEPRQVLVIAGNCLSILGSSHSFIRPTETFQLGYPPFYILTLIYVIRFTLLVDSLYFTINLILKLIINRVSINTT
jgi:hypothetical protein